jgi:ATP-dependent DNA helicase RecG
MLAEAAVCFANTEGGVIVLGVDDRQRGPGAFVGTRFTTDDVRRLIHERTTPKLTVEARPLTREGRSLVAAYVPEGLEVHSTTAGRALERPRSHRSTRRTSRPSRSSRRDTGSPVSQTVDRSSPGYRRSISFVLSTSSGHREASAMPVRSC